MCGRKHEVKNNLLHNVPYFALIIPQSMALDTTSIPSLLKDLGVRAYLVL